MELLNPRPGISQIKPYRPSRPPSDGQPWIDLSLTVNSLGPSPKAMTAYRQMASQIHRYPDADHGELRHALSRRFDLDPDRVSCAAGSDEMIQLIVQAFAGPGDEVLFHEYGYRGFARAARVAGATPVIARERDLVVDIESLIERANERTKVCLLANPNNPTGTYVPTEAVHRLRAGLPPHTLLVLDSAFAEYVVHRNNYTAGADLVEDYDNVVMVRTFSKLFGLAGLRIGWAYGSPTVIDAVDRVRGPFNVTAPAQAAAVAALADAEHDAATLANTQDSLSWLGHELETLGVRVYPSVCNFLLARIPPDPALGVAAITEHLARRSILVKTLGEYGLADCLRITVGTEEENHALIKALGEILS